MSDEDSDSIQKLISEWRTSRRADIADTIQELTVKEPEILSAFWKARSTPAAEKHFREVIAHAPDDPRMTVLFLKCVHKAHWSGSGAAKLWSTIFERIVALRDPRAIEPLRDAAGDLPHFQGIAHSKWIAEELTKTAAALESACGGVVPSASSPYFRREKKSTASNTVDLVWANPEDDAIKLVVADSLLEKNDPWGEFITLGMKIADPAVDPAEKQKLEKRTTSLLNKHAQVFGGPIAFIATKTGWAFEKGFLVSFAADRSQVPRRRWEEAAHAPHLATVRTITLDNRHTPKWWITEIVKSPHNKSLRMISGDRGRFLIQRDHSQAPWRITAISPNAMSVVDAVARGLSPSDVARILIEIPTETLAQSVRDTLANVRR